MHMSPTTCDRNEEDVDSSLETQYPHAVGAVATARPVHENEPAIDVLGHMVRLEASTRTALALLRRCIVEEQTPTREALTSEAEFVFGLPGEAALAEMDQVAEMMGISSLR